MLLIFILSLNQQWGYTPLLRAVAEGHTDVVQFLLECGGDVLGQTKVSEQGCSSKIKTGQAMDDVAQSRGGGGGLGACPPQEIFEV